MLFRGKEVTDYKAVAVLKTAFSAILVFLAVTAATLAVVFLAALGVLSVLVSLGCITGLLRNVATDIAPPAMLFTGLFCLSAAASLFMGLAIICPKAVRRFNSAVEKHLL